MTTTRDFIDGTLHGPWRAVLVLGVTQIVSWGCIYYTPVLIVPLITAERGWSIAFGMGGFSAGLLTAGLVLPYVGRLIDRLGGHVVMTAGSLIGAVGLILIVNVTSPIAYLAVWAVLGVAMAANLYDAAFATLGRIFGAAARRPITALTLAGGFASTVSWPATHALLERFDWHATYLIYAGVLAFISAPLHAFGLPRSRAATGTRPAADGDAKPARILPARGVAFLLVAAGFTAYAFVPSGLAAHLLAIFDRAGIAPATVVWIGALFGPAQVGARLIEFAIVRDMHPLWIMRFALGVLLVAFAGLALLGISPATAAVFALMFGGANGLVTISRGAVPLALFGASGYGHLLGRLAGPFLLMQAAAPLLMALVIERVSDAAAMALTAGFAVVALACFAVIRKPN
jgi:MFS family permease